MDKICVDIDQLKFKCFWSLDVPIFATFLTRRHFNTIFGLHLPDFFLFCIRREHENVLNGSVTKQSRCCLLWKGITEFTTCNTHKTHPPQDRLIAVVEFKELKNKIALWKIYLSRTFRYS